MNFKSNIKPRNPEKKHKKKYILNNLYALFNCRDAFESRIFLIKIEGTDLLDLATLEKVFDNSNLKILTPK